MADTHTGTCFCGAVEIEVSSAPWGLSSRSGWFRGGDARTGSVTGGVCPKISSVHSPYRRLAAENSLVGAPRGRRAAGPTNHISALPQSSCDKPEGDWADKSINAYAGGVGEPPKVALGVSRGTMFWELSDDAECLTMQNRA